MTTLQLFLYILLGILAQITIAALLAIYRHLRSYQHLQKRMVGMGDEVPAEPRLKDFIPKVSKGKTTPWKDLREFKVVRRVYEDADQKICSFYLQPTDKQGLPDYKPGQFLTFNLDVTDPVSKKPTTITRCYTLSDAPGHPYYRVSIKRAPPPPDQPGIPVGVSSNHFHDNVQEGDSLLVRAPSGHFFLAPDTSPIVLIGGGIGITPMISMLNATLNTGSKRDIWLFYGVTNSDDQGMKTYLEDLALKHNNFHLHVCYAHPKLDDKFGRDFKHEGYVDVNLLRQTLSYQIYNFFVCGPRVMMETLVPALEDWGVPEQHIHYETFGPASIVRKSNQAQVSAQDDAQSNTPEREPIKVTFAKSGKTLDWDGRSETLLEFAESNGIDVDSGCRAGGCGCCQTKITNGEVDYTHTPDFDAKAGTCLLCVSRPTQDLTLEA